MRRRATWVDDIRGGLRAIWLEVAVVVVITVVALALAAIVLVVV